MQYDEVRPTLLQIFCFKENEGKFLTAEQICEVIKESFPKIWEEIASAFPETDPGHLYPHLKSKYTPVRFIENALKYYAINNGIPELEQGEISITNIGEGRELKTIVVWRLG